MRRAELTHDNHKELGRPMPTMRRRWAWAGSVNHDEEGWADPHRS